MRWAVTCHSFRYCCHRFRLAAGHAPGGRLPQAHILGEQVGLGAHQPVGLGGQAAHDFVQGGADMERVGTQRRRAVGLTQRGIGDGALGGEGGAGQIDRHLLQQLALGRRQRAELGRARLGLLGGFGFGLRLLRGRRRRRFGGGRFRRDLRRRPARRRRDGSADDLGDRGDRGRFFLRGLILLRDGGGSLARGGLGGRFTAFRLSAGLGVAHHAVSRLARSAPSVTQRALSFVSIIA
jgi:hypothetical protein